MKDATGLLDDVIAVVNEHGFNAETYYDKDMQGCYIGLLRRAAGHRGDPRAIASPSNPNRKTCEPETPLATALMAVDQAAIAHHAAMRDAGKLGLWIALVQDRAPGRAAENYGLNLVREGFVSRSQQAPTALEVLRAARASLASPTPEPMVRVLARTRKESRLRALLHA